MATKTISPLSLSEYRALVTNIPVYCPNATFTVAGQNFTASGAVDFINTVLNAVAAVATAKGDWKDAILAEQKAVAAGGATVRAIRNNIAAMFSNQQNTLAAFEITPRKPYVPLTAAKRAAATAKAKATRLARGTASKKAKAAITGDVTGVTITPVTSSSGTSGSGASSAATTNPAPAPAPAVGSAPAATASGSPVTPSAAVVPAAAQPVPVASASPAPAAPSAAPAPAASVVGH